MDKIYKTKDYSIFKDADNRKIVPHHIDYFAKKLEHDKDYLERCPVVVSKSLHILDGQHRIKGAMKVKAPVFYYIDPNPDTMEEIKQSIKERNVNQMTWRISDYIYTYSQDDYEYKFLYNLTEKYKKHFSTSSIVYLCNISGDGKFGKNKFIKSGNMKITNKNQVKEFLDIFYEYVDNLTIPCEKKMTLCCRVYLSQIMNLYFNPFPRHTYQLFIKNLPNNYTCIAQVILEADARQIINTICCRKTMKV